MMQQLSGKIQNLCKGFLLLGCLLSGCATQAPDDSLLGHASGKEILPPPMVRPDSRVGRLVKAPDNSGKSVIDSQAPEIWQRLFALYQLPELDNRRIRRELTWYGEHAEYLEKVQKRAEPYLYAIVEEVEKNGLPGEIALLPVIESAFKPQAYSSGHAAGIWQFIPATGRHYGLRQSWWYDGRRDIHASTQAAVTYLSKLARQFDNDWLLVLAAYNCGEGTVSRAIARNQKQGKPTDYWNLPLPAETRRYVPKLLAVSRMFAKAELYNMALLDIPNRPYYQTVDIGSQLDVALAARLADMDTAELFALNPGLNRWATDPDGPHHMLIPVEKVQRFTDELDKLEDSQRVQWRRHRIRSGDTLGQLARRYGTTTKILKQINNLRSSNIRAGRHLLVPLSSELQPILAQLPNSGGATQLIHQVKTGDTFWDIAREYGVAISDIERWNSLDKNEPLRAGLKLAIQQPGDSGQKVTYRVKRGDSLYLIARRFNVSIDDLQRWNNRVEPESLRPGQILKVMVASGPST